MRTLLEMAVTYPYSAVWNMTGQPAGAVPAPGMSRRRPAARRAAGRPAGREGLLLSLAAQIEAEIGWPARRPPVS